MTRKQFSAYAKKYGITVLIAIPVLVCLNILMANKTSMAVMILVNCVVILCFFVITLYVADVIKRKTQEKRAKFVAEKEKQAAQENANLFKEKEEEKQQKKWQKQKKNYPSTKKKK